MQSWYAENMKKWERRNETAPPLTPGQRAASDVQNSVTLITQNVHTILIPFKTCLNACQSHTMRAGGRVFFFLKRLLVSGAQTNEKAPCP